jgi:hypothetical protein
MEQDLMFSLMDVSPVLVTSLPPFYARIPSFWDANVYSEPLFLQSMQLVFYFTDAHG